MKRSVNMMMVALGEEVRCAWVSACRVEENRPERKEQHHTGNVYNVHKEKGLGHGTLSANVENLEWCRGEGSCEQGEEKTSAFDGRRKEKENNNLTLRPQKRTPR
jgi:hypothetical protein